MNLSPWFTLVISDVYDGLPCTLHFLKVPLAFILPLGTHGSGFCVQTDWFCPLESLCLVSGTQATSKPREVQVRSAFYHAASALSLCGAATEPFDFRPI